MANVLVKPISERDGNLVILADNTQDMFLVNWKTGEVLEKGTNTGASNGRGATFRFTQPGAAYQNVGLMDENGNVLLIMEDASRRVKFNYNDYGELVRRPVSTVKGMSFDNSKNVEAMASGRPTSADVGNMTSEEYNQHLQNQLSGSEIDTPVTDASQSAIKAFPVASNPMVLATAGPAIAAAKGVEQVGKALGITDRKTTKDYQRERLNEILANTENPAIRDQIMRMTDSGAHELTADDIRSGKGSFGNGDRREELIRERMAKQYEAHGGHAAKDLTMEIPERVWGSKGILKTVGADTWLGDMNEEQRWLATQEGIKRGLFENSKGDIMVRGDKEDEFLSVVEEIRASANEGSEYDAIYGQQAAPAPDTVLVEPSQQAGGVNTREAVQSTEPTAATDVEVSDPIDAIMLAEEERMAEEEEMRKKNMMLGFLEGQAARDEQLLSQFNQPRSRNNFQIGAEQLSRSFK